MKARWQRATRTYAYEARQPTRAADKNLVVCEHCDAVWDEAHRQGHCDVAEATRDIDPN